MSDVDIGPYEQVIEPELQAFLDHTATTHVAQLNKIAPAGLEYRYEGDTIKQYAVDRRAISFILDTGVPKDVASTVYATMAEGIEPFNFKRIQMRFLMFKDWFNYVRKNEGSSTVAVPLCILHTSLLNAEIATLSRGQQAVFIHSGIKYFQSWCIYFQVWSDLIPTRSEVEERWTRRLTLNEPSNREGYEKGQLYTSLSKILQKVAFACLGELVMDKELNEWSTRWEQRFWNMNDTALKANADYENRTINWDMAEAFLIFHEFGHVLLGHVDEISSWTARSRVTDEEYQFRRTRRMEMEYEADRFAMPYAIRIQNLIRKTNLQRPLTSPNDDTREEMYINILNPISKLFLLFHLDENAWRREQAPESPYPKSRDRFERLVGKQPLIQEEWDELTMILNIPPHVDMVIPTGNTNKPI